MWLVLICTSSKDYLNKMLTSWIFYCCSAALWQCVDLQAVNVSEESATSVFRAVLYVGNHPRNYTVWWNIRLQFHQRYRQKVPPELMDIKYKNKLGHNLVQCNKNRLLHWRWKQQVFQKFHKVPMRLYSNVSQSTKIQICNYLNWPGSH